VQLTIERVMLLRTVDFFASTDADILAAVAGILEEVDVSAGEQIIRAGELSSAMYITVYGRVRVHDGDTVLAELGRGEVFGELSALDPEPRTASVTACEDTKLLRLDHEALFDMMAQRVEVAHAIIRFLVRRYGRRHSPHPSAAK
jgi:CRP/FNR family transcriptional regulator, cyclic AMP receptor protein